MRHPSLAARKGVAGGLWPCQRGRKVSHAVFIERFFARMFVSSASAVSTTLRSMLNPQMALCIPRVMLPWRAAAMTGRTYASRRTGARLLRRAASVAMAAHRMVIGTMKTSKRIGNWIFEAPGNISSQNIIP